MSTASYSELKTAVANWLNRSDLTSYIPDFVTFGEKQIYRDLRIRCMEAALSDTIASGVVAVPTGYVAMKYAYVNGSPVTSLIKKDAEFIYAEYPTRSSTGTPKFFAREVDNFIFGPYPDSAYTIKGVYYKRLDALSDSNTTNWFTANAPDLLLYASLIAAEPFLKNDERLATWTAFYMKIKDDIQREDKQEEFSGSPLAVVAR